MRAKEGVLGTEVGEGGAWDGAGQGLKGQMENAQPREDEPERSGTLETWGWKGRRSWGLETRPRRAGLGPGRHIEARRGPCLGC